MQLIDYKLLSNFVKYMKQLGIAVIGAGEIAQNFHIPILKNLPSVSLLAICDRNKSKSRSVAEKYEVPYICHDFEELLDIEGLEAVDICTSTDSHCEIAVACLKRGINVLIEKPIARNLDETIKISKAAKESGAKAMVAMNSRFRYDAKMLKNYIHTGEIGDVFYIRGGWLQQKRNSEWLHQIERAGGGVLLDLGISIMDSMLWIYNFPKIKSVQASIFHHLTKEVEDVCVASVLFENGSIATLEVSWSLYSARTNYFFFIHGSKGYAQVNPLQLFKISGDVYQPSIPQSTRTNYTIYKKSFEGEIKHFVNAVLGYVPIISTADEAVEIMKLIEAMYQSAKEQREILL
ncbi:MAG: Gfo/Idh/MocA family oxidoreductase [Bacteroidota bacterium]|nr:Gfo/Idh/MocA family oxidoreductase [Bacteroidota bacterium]